MSKPIEVLKVFGYDCYAKGHWTGNGIAARLKQYENDPLIKRAYYQLITRPTS